MGKTSKRLTIVALSPVNDWPELATLEAQGHTILRATAADKMPAVWSLQADVILGPACWRMDEAHRKYLPLAIATVRRIKYPPKKGELDDE
jgi:hypothetical protein